MKLTIETLHAEVRAKEPYQKAITIWTKVLEIVNGRSKMMQAGVLRYLAFCHARTSKKSDLEASYDYYTKSLDVMVSMGDGSAAAAKRCRVVQIERLQTALQISSSVPRTERNGFSKHSKSTLHVHHFRNRIFSNFDTAVSC